MRQNQRCRQISMLIILLCYGSQAVSNGATAAEISGAAILDVCQLTLLPSDLDAKELVGVYGEVRFLNATKALIVNRHGPHYAVEVDIQRMSRRDSARLAGSCRRSGCPEIVTGAFVRGRLHAIRSFAQRNDLEIPSSCPALGKETRVTGHRT
jgi:hypothetical protein